MKDSFSMDQGLGGDGLGMIQPFIVYFISDLKLLLI